MVVTQKQFHQMVEQGYDCHHDKHSLTMVRLLFVVVLNEWLRMLLGLST
jgi:hypothetical protein